MYYLTDEKGFVRCALFGGRLEDGIFYDGPLPEAFKEEMRAFYFDKGSGSFQYDEKRGQWLKKEKALLEEKGKIERLLEEFDKKSAVYERRFKFGLYVNEEEMDLILQEAKDSQQRLDEIEKELSLKGGRNG